MADISINDFRILATKRIETLLKMEKSLGEEVVKAQARLWDMISSEYLNKFDLDALGNVIINPKNMALMGEYDKVWDKFNTLYQNNIVSGFANDLLKITDLSSNYFLQMGLSGATESIKHLGEMRKLLEAQLGVKFGRGISRTEFLPGGYLDRLIQGDDLRKAVRNLVASQVSSSASFSDFSKKFHDLIVGSPDVEGKLVKHWRTYAYDTFSGVQASADLYQALSLGLKYFVYDGTIILSTRPFCEERVGHVYSIEEAKAWENETWAGKNPDSSFFIARGGYNCRHQLDFISDTLAEEWRGREGKPIETRITPPPEAPKKVIPPLKPKVPKPKVIKPKPSPAPQSKVFSSTNTPLRGLNGKQVFEETFGTKYKFDPLPEDATMNDFRKRLKALGVNSIKIPDDTKMSVNEMNSILEGLERTIKNFNGKLQEFGFENGNFAGYHTPIGRIDGFEMKYNTSIIKINKGYLADQYRYEKLSKTFSPGIDDNWSNGFTTSYRMTSFGQAIFSTTTHEGFHAIYYQHGLHRSWINRLIKLGKDLELPPFNAGALVGDDSAKSILRMINRAMIDAGYQTTDYFGANIKEAWTETGAMITQGWNVHPLLKEAFFDVLETINF